MIGCIASIIMRLDEWSTYHLGDGLDNPFISFMLIGGFRVIISLWLLVHQVYYQVYHIPILGDPKSHRPAISSKGRGDLFVRDVRTWRPTIVVEVSSKHGDILRDITKKIWDLVEPNRSCNQYDTWVCPKFGGWDPKTWGNSWETMRERLPIILRQTHLLHTKTGMT